MKKLHLFKYIKKYMPYTLFGRVFLIILIPIITIQSITTFVFIDRHWERITKQLADDIASNVVSIVKLLETNALSKTQVINFSEKHYGLSIKIKSYKPSMTIPTIKNITWREEFVKEALSKHLKFPYYFKIRKEIIFINVFIPKKAIYIQIPKKRLFSKTTYVFLVWSIATPILFFIIALLFMKNQIRPIKRLAEAVSQFGKGKPIKKFKPEGALEVRKTAIAFNVMRARIQRHITQRTAMLSAVSHDLRTPLTRMELQLAMMEKSPETNSLKTDLKEMTSTIKEYLNFAKGEDRENRSFINLFELLKETTKPLKQKKIKLSLQADKNIIINARPNAIKRCLSNIFYNAARYSKKIYIETKKTKKDCTIIIHDDGPGIPKDQRLDVFKPFFRLDSSRNTATGGIGLGLAIAQDIISHHGGTISLGDSPYGGLKVTIRLPF